MYPPPRCAFKEETTYIFEDSNINTCQCPSSGTPTLPPQSGEIFGQNSSVSKSDQLHVVVFWFLCTNLRYILYIPQNDR